MKYHVIGQTNIYWDVTVEAENEDEAIDTAEEQAMWDIEVTSIGSVNIDQTEFDYAEVDE